MAFHLPSLHSQQEERKIFQVDLKTSVTRPYYILNVQALPATVAAASSRE
jgi:hypothetical protein